MLQEIGFQDKDIKRSNGHCVLGNGNIERVRDHIFVRVNYANPGFACFCFVLGYRCLSKTTTTITRATKKHGSDELEG